MSVVGQRCPVCNGKGLVPRGFYDDMSYGLATTDLIINQGPEICRSCNGKGYIIVTTKTPFVRPVEYRKCRTCRFKDSLVYMSNPPQYRCTIDGHFHDENYLCSKYDKEDESESTNTTF